MSAVLGTAAVATAAPPRQALQHLWLSWRSLRLRELGWFLWFGGVIAGLNLLTLADGAVGQRSPGLMFTEGLMPILCGLLLMLVWLPADRSALVHPRRNRRMVSAVLLASALAALLLPLLVELFDLPTVMQVAYARKKVDPPGWLAASLASFLSMLAPSALAIGVIEMARRHRHSRETLARSLHEQAALARSTLESRLAAMQAQVEPQFLFDVLVDIERLYGLPPCPTGERTAALQMERLITYLRVALPRLRESGSTLGAEVDLLGSYLDLVQALRGGRPAFSVDLPEALRGVTFHPMLLLPLVQRAVRSSGPPPSWISLRAERGTAGLTLLLTLAAPDLCRSDSELQRLQERLQVLYGGRASLQCDELVDAGAEAGGAEAAGALLTRFTLSLPA
jgi:hypothetical protein